MDFRALLGFLLVTTALAGCTNGPGTDDTELDSDATETIDCEDLVADHDGETQEEHEAHAGDERLPEECEELFTPVPDPLIHINQTGCKYMGAAAFAPEDLFGPPPDGLSYQYFQVDGARLLSITAVGVECQELQFRNGTIDGPRFFSTFVQVEPHADWTDTDYSHHWMAELVVKQEDTWAVFDEADMDRTFTAPVEWGSLYESNMGLIGSTGYEVDGFEVEVLVEAAGTPDPIEFGQRMYMENDEGGLTVMDVALRPHDQALGDAKILFSPGIGGTPVTPYAGIGVYGGGNDGGFDLRMTRLLPEDDA